jgi:Sugar-transfer associated ATP-grasp
MSASNLAHVEISEDSAATTGAHDAPALFDTVHADKPIDKLEAFRRICAESGRKPTDIVKEFFTLSQGRGRLTFRDYISYRLYDDKFIGDADKTAFIGRRRNQELVGEINYRHEWNCLSDDKIANVSYLASYGLPVIPTKAIFAPNMRGGAKNLLKSRSELRRFLSDPAQYPMFGKPLDGFQSLGSMVLVNLDRETGLITTSRAVVSVDALVDAIDTNFKNGYIFQPQLHGHSDLVPTVGTGLSTARVVTIATDDGPRLFSAAWKIIGGGNVADNYWRPGNILAALDLGSGRVLKAVTGHGFEMKDIDHHPSTGAVLQGLALPKYQDVIESAVEGHRTLRNIGIIGWDIGVTDEGPVIVETNIMPDLMLVQAAHRSGAFNDDLAALLARQKAGVEAHKRAMFATLVKD